MRSLPRSLSIRLKIQRQDRSVGAIMAIVFDAKECSLGDLSSAVLGATETLFFSRIGSSLRKRNYVLGRYAAKIALRSALDEPELKAIEINRGVFEHPVVQYDRNTRWEVSISHSQSLAIALAYPVGHPMGIDIEYIDAAHEQTILSQLSENEIGWVKRHEARTGELATALWTAKEALSKALRTGLMSPIEIYNVVELHSIDSGVWEGSFRNFPQYKARVWIGTSYTLSIVLPKRSAFALKGELRSIL